jgi:hypothetical protein
MPLEPPLQSKRINIPHWGLRVPDRGGIVPVANVQDPRIRAALELLGDDYTRVIRVEKPPNPRNGWVYPQEDIIRIDPGSAAYKGAKRDDRWSKVLASLLAHERVHAEGNPSEADAYERQSMLLQKFLDNDNGAQGEYRKTVASRAQSERLQTALQAKR